MCMELMDATFVFGSFCFVFGKILQPVGGVQGEFIHLPADRTTPAVWIMQPHSLPNLSFLVYLCICVFVYLQRIVQHQQVMRIFDGLVKCALTFSFVFLQKITVSATNSTVCKRYRTQPDAMSLFFVLCCLCICVCKNQGLLQRGGRSKQGNREPVPSPPPFFHPSSSSLRLK